MSEELDYLTPQEHRKMLHAIGHCVDASKCYRNYFAAGGDDVVIMDSLETRGLVQKWVRNPPFTEGLTYYSVSPKGFDLLKKFRG